MLRYLCFFYIVLYVGGYSCAAPPRAVEGVLDLRTWNWEEQGSVRLDGQWEWYWQEFYPPSAFSTTALPPPNAYVAVPGVWNEYVPTSWWKQGQGYATYRLRVLLPSSHKILGMKVLTASTALDMYINGQRIGGAGKVGRTADSMTPDMHPFVYTWPSRTDTLEIIAHVSNFYYRKGGLWNAVTLGTDAQIQNLRIQRLIRDFFLIGSFLLIGLYHIGIYIFWRRIYAPLLFGVFCILIILRILTTGEYAITLGVHWPWTAIVRIEFISFFCMAPIFTLFSRALFPREFLSWVTQAIVYIGLGFVLLVLLLPSYWFTFLIRPFQVYLLLSLSYALSAYIKAWLRKRKGSTYFLLGFMILFASVVNDILFTSFIIYTGHLFYIGIFVFVFSQAMSLSQQFASSFTDLELANKELEVLNEELKTVNDELMEKGNDIEAKNHQLMQLNANLDSVMHRVSHDLRSPIASVLGLIGLIQEEKDMDQVQTYVELQEKTLHRMDRLIQDIIDYSKNKSTEITLEAIDFQMLIKDVLQDHEYMDAASHITQTVEVDQEGVFVSDSRRLTVVLANLISNAIRYHNTRIPDPFIRIQVEAKADNAFIEVQDNGQGIGQEHLDKIFQMFYRANEQTKGSGLGLYIVHEAITKLQGSIEVESTVGKGTTFRIIIPNLAARQAAQQRGAG